MNESLNYSFLLNTLQRLRRCATLQTSTKVHMHIFCYLFDLKNSL